METLHRWLIIHGQHIRIGLVLLLVLLAACNNSSDGGGGGGY